LLILPVVASVLVVTPSAGQPSLEEIVVVPQDTTVAVGSIVQFRAWGLFDDEIWRDVTTSAFWSSTDPGWPRSRTVG